MKTLRFYGSSDDLFECDGDVSEEIDNCANGSVMAYRVHSNHSADGGVLIVSAIYSPRPVDHGCWVIGVSLDEEDTPLPKWPMRWETAENGYSPVLVIEAPNDVDVAVVSR